jgi:hypothetical protein
MKNKKKNLVQKKPQKVEIKIKKIKLPVEHEKKQIDYQKEPILNVLKKTIKEKDWDFIKRYFGLIGDQMEPFFKLVLVYSKALLNNINQATKESGLELLKVLMNVYPRFISKYGGFVSLSNELIILLSKDEGILDIFLGYYSLVVQRDHLSSKNKEMNPLYEFTTVFFKNSFISAEHDLSNRNSNTRLEFCSNEFKLVEYHAANALFSEAQQSQLKNLLTIYYNEGTAAAKNKILDLAVLLNITLPIEPSLRTCLVNFDENFVKKYISDLKNDRGINETLIRIVERNSGLATVVVECDLRLQTKKSLKLVQCVQIASLPSDYIFDHLFPRLMGNNDEEYCNLILDLMVEFMIKRPDNTCPKFLNIVDPVKLKWIGIDPYSKLIQFISYLNPTRELDMWCLELFRGAPSNARDQYLWFLASTSESNSNWRQCLLFAVIMGKSASAIEINALLPFYSKHFKREVFQKLLAEYNTSRELSIQISEKFLDLMQ